MQSDLRIDLFFVNKLKQGIGWYKLYRAPQNAITIYTSGLP